MLKAGTTVCNKRRGLLHVKGGDHCMLKAGTTVC